MYKDKFILITAEKQKFLISQKEYDGIWEAIKGNDKYARVQNCVISLAITPTIVSFGRWYAQEEERLATMNKRLCRICFKIMDVSDKCQCWMTTGRGKKQNAFEAPAEQLEKFGVKENLKKLEEKFSWPKHYEENPMPAISAPEPVVENEIVDYQIDPETGEKLYS